MKTKFQKVLAISLIAIILCSCATKEKDNFDSASNPFDASAHYVSFSVENTRLIPLKFILSQLTILYPKCCKFLIRHIVEI